MKHVDLAPSGLVAGRYDIERLIGRGGMASVYLARDRKHDRRVALKVIDPDLVQSATADRFLREIAIAATLTHPHILPLHDSGSDEGVLYYVMPYVEGETLRGRLARERQLPLDEALRIACEVASALDYAHRRGVLHRDVKPDNILLEDGHAVLADFGIARALDASLGSGMTETGVTIGTPTYMSPEQASAGTLDGRSDQYSLACVLHEMLAGEPPFTGATPQAVIAKRLHDAPPRIRTVRPSVPERLERVLLTALDRTPADRFSTAGRFRDALAVCTQPDASRPVAALPHRALRAGAAAALVLAVLAGGWALRDRWLAPAAVKTIAVLPFANASSDPEHAYLAEGLADALISDLVRVSGVRVVSRMSAMRYASGMGGGMAAGMTGGAPADAGAMPDMPGGMAFMNDGMPMADKRPPAGDGATGGGMAVMPRKSVTEIARELGAGLVLQGTLARKGDIVHVTASLVSTDPLETLWQQSASRPVHEMFTLQRELATAVAAAVTRDRADRAVYSAATREYDPAAHDAYLKGSYYQAHWKLPQALEAFERAVQLDATHASAHAGLSRAYYFLGFFGDIPPSVALAGMRRAATAALELDAGMAEAHAQLALVKMLQDWDWEGAERHFRRALEISPEHAQIRHDYAHFLLGQGRQRESMEQTREAVAFDPVNPMLISCLGWHSLFDARYDEAARHAGEAIDMMPDDWAKVVLGWARLGQGSAEEALQAFRDAVRLKESAFTLASLAHGLAAAGRDAEARRALDGLLQRMEREYVSPYDLATVYAGLGEADAAFTWLRRAAEERSLFIVHVGWDARFDRIRDDPRLGDLTAREMRLPSPRFALVRAADRHGM
jgi:eukaryotic-like serine/threonine-protein kinase